MVIGGSAGLHTRSTPGSKASGSRREFTGTLCSWCVLLASLPSPGPLCSSSGQLNKIQQLHSQRMWVIDMVCLHNMNLVAVASTDQRIGESLAAPQACSWLWGATHLRLERSVREPTRSLDQNPLGTPRGSEQWGCWSSPETPEAGMWVWVPCVPPCVFSAEFFDISNHSCVPAFTFIDLDSCVLVMDYW